MGKMYRAPRRGRGAYASVAQRDAKGRIMKKVASAVVTKALKTRGLKTVEQKYYSEINNTGIMQNTLTWSASSNILNPLVQSDAHDGRDGYQVQPVNIQVKGIINCSNGVSGIGRVLLVRWDDSDIPSLSDFFESPASALQLPTVLFNREQRKNFKVYYDRSFIISSLADSKGRAVFNINVNCRSHKPVIYTSGAYSESAFTQGRYYLLYFSDVSATNGPVINFSNRFTYTG